MIQRCTGLMASRHARKFYSRKACYRNRNAKQDGNTGRIPRETKNTASQMTPREKNLFLLSCEFHDHTAFNGMLDLYTDTRRKEQNRRKKQKEELEPLEMLLNLECCLTIAPLSSVQLENIRIFIFPIIIMSREMSQFLIEIGL
ncbi:unnamed protein product [Wuchereria bancrofti]|uniref:Uncharacterized protein n=1 Tax=Wuchereria bancrofti TaxID=6293 RepID=A0A3P7DN27_WUCBA|nr:unnamed protein product [Wuchereria bancrofti]